MGRMYIQQIDSTTGGAANEDIWSLVAGAADKIILHGWELTSAAIAAALVEVNLHRVTAVGSGGSASTTEEKLDETDSANTAGVRVNDTTGGADGGGLAYYQWEQLGPLGQVYTPEMRPVCQETDGVALTLVTASAITVSGWICWEEI